MQSEVTICVVGLLKTVVDCELLYLVTFISKKGNELLFSCSRVNETDGKK